MFSADKSDLQEAHKRKYLHILVLTNLKIYIESVREMSTFVQLFQSYYLIIILNPISTFWFVH